MPLSSRTKNRIMDALNKAFGDIGTDTLTKGPKSRENTAPTAWEYFVSYHIAGLAKARLEAAKKNCVKAGILFDHEKFPREPGDSGLVYTGEYVGVMLTVKRAGNRIDTDKLFVALQERGVKESVINEAYEAAKYQTRPAHEFRPTLVVNDNTSGK